MSFLRRTFGARDDKYLRLIASLQFQAELFLHGDDLPPSSATRIVRVRPENGCAQSSCRQPVGLGITSEIPPDPPARTCAEEIAAATGYTSLAMALSSGHRLGQYEVLSLLGAGGMGEVYRARDTKLVRDVALKVLPEVFARDPERIARFKREAQVLASLNHPHIGSIYGIEESPSTGSGQAHVQRRSFQLVEGMTLA